MPAPPLANTFEGGTDTVAISAANSGGASGDAFSSILGTSSVFSATQKRDTMGMAVVQGGTYGISGVRWSGHGQLVNTYVYFRFYAFIPASMPTFTRICGWNALSGSTPNCTLGIKTDGRLEAYNTSATAVGIASTDALPSGAWCRIEARARTNGTTGDVEWRYYSTPDAAVGSYDETKSASAVAMSADIDQSAFGNVANAGSISVTWYFDDLGVATADWLGPTAGGSPPQTLRPDADTADGGWTTTPLWSKVDEASADGTVITATAS
jgi:hypothetical protein